MMLILHNTIRNMRSWVELTNWSPWRKAYAIWPVRDVNGKYVTGTMWVRSRTIVDYTINKRRQEKQRVTNVFDMIRIERKDHTQ